MTPVRDAAAYAAQLDEKVARLRELLAPFAAPEPAVFDSPAEHYRLRAEFRLWREQEERHYAMFEAGDKHTPILIDEFPIASQRINQLMPQLKAAWQASRVLSFKLFQVEFLTTLAGDALITLCYHRPLDAEWQAEAEQLATRLGVSLVGRSRGQRLVIGRDYVEEEMTVAGRTFRYRQPEGAFTQPNGTVCQKMLQWAYDALGQRDGRTARRILLLGMVYLRDAYAVAAHAADHLRQLAVEAEHQVDAQAVVRGVEERTAFFPAIAAQLLQTICPARRAADDRNPCVDARPDVAVGRVGGRELQCYVDAGQVCGIQFRCVRLVDDGADTVSPFEEYFFDFTAHFAVSDDRCFHWLKGILRYIIANIAIRRRNKK